MAVLIEGISVVVRCDIVAGLYPGGVNAFCNDVPNGSLCADGELASVGFMVPADAKQYVEFLGERGIRYHNDNQACDLVVVDQRSGLRARCTWASFGTTYWNDDPSCPIAVCQAIPTKIDRVVVPNGWVFPRSLSASHQFVGSDELPKSLRIVRRDDVTDVYLDEETGNELYVRRARSGN